MDFSDKRVLITGASRGIGYAAAKEFLSLGARVAINGRTEQSGVEEAGVEAVAEPNSGDLEEMEILLMTPGELFASILDGEIALLGSAAAVALATNSLLHDPATDGLGPAGSSRKAG